MPTLTDVIERLAALDMAGWQGLPERLTVDDGGDVDEAGPPTRLELGDDHVPADMVHLAGTARAWSRAGHVVLVDVAVGADGDAAALATLGPADTESVRYGLIPAEERVYGQRGVAAIVDAGGDVVRHVMGFIPTSAAEYRRTLRPGFATTRRPLEDR
jgi:hypothetical protein